MSIPRLEPCPSAFPTKLPGRYLVDVIFNYATYIIEKKNTSLYYDKTASYTVASVLSHTFIMLMLYL